MRTKRSAFLPFNLEKPLWVFVGSSVEKATGSGDERAVHVGRGANLTFVAGFLHGAGQAQEHIAALLYGSGQTTGLLYSRW